MNVIKKQSRFKIWVLRFYGLLNYCPVEISQKDELYTIWAVPIFSL